MSYKLKLVCFVVIACLPAFAAIERGVMLREGVIYVDPSTDSAKLSNIGRGREVAVMQRANGWANVMGTVDIGYAPEDPDTQVDRNVTGWVKDQGIILPSTPDGDKILFGEAFDSEMEASKRGGRRNAAQDAMRLYGHLPEIFPQSPLAAEGAYRAADIRWQIEAADAASRPSAKERDPALHVQIDEDFMRKVMKKYPAHEVGRPRRLSPHRQQAVRRLGSPGQVSGERSSDVHQVRRRASAIAQDARSTLQSRVAIFGADPDLPDQQQSEESRRVVGSDRSGSPRS